MIEENLMEIGEDLESQDSPTEVSTNTVPKDFNENLLKYLIKDDAHTQWLTALGQKVYENFTQDNETRSEWADTCTKGIENLGLKYEEINDPWPGACSATHPVILEAAISFQAKAVPELLPATGPCKTQILGKITPEKEEQALRVKEYLNYLTTKEMTEYYPDMEKLLFYLPLYGSVFKKNYFDPILQRPVSEFISPFDVVVPYEAPDLYRAERFTEIGTATNKEMEDLSEQGYYLETEDLFKGGNYTADENPLREKENREVGITAVAQVEDRTYNLLHQYIYLDLPEDANVPLSREDRKDPYCVTVDKDTLKVIRISRNWRQWDNVFRKRKVHHVHYKFIPAFSFYGLGYFHLLGNAQASLTTILRSLVDSGELANMQGGFKLKGTKLAGDNSTFIPGEWKDIESTNQDITKTMLPINYKEPSQTLYTLWGQLTQMAQKFADSTDQVVADSTNYGPVGTTVALIEHSMKLFSAIHKRTHKSQEQDLKLIAECLYEYFPQEEYPYDVVGDEKKVFKTDFDPNVIDVVPCSDPNIFSQAQRLALASARLQAVQLFPQQHDVVACLRAYYVSLGEQDPDRYLGPDPSKAPPPPPQDPLTDIISVVNNKPIKAYQGQDHNAHIIFKSSWLQDPVAGGASPLMQVFVPVIQANIREHMITKYQEDIAASAVTGVGSDQKTQEMILATAAQNILQINQALAQQGTQNEPLQKIAEAELIKANVDKDALRHKLQTDAGKLALEAQKIDVARQREANRALEAGAKADQAQFDSIKDTVERQIDRLENRANKE